VTDKKSKRVASLGCLEWPSSRHAESGWHARPADRC
jgi:hypothetical protein